MRLEKRTLSFLLCQRSVTAVAPVVSFPSVLVPQRERQDSRKRVCRRRRRLRRQRTRD